MDLANEINDENKSKELINIVSFIVDMENSNKSEELIKIKNAGVIKSIDSNIREALLVILTGISSILRI